MTNLESFNLHLFLEIPGLLGSLLLLYYFNLKEFCIFHFSLLLISLYSGLMGYILQNPLTKDLDLHYLKLIVRIK